MNTEGRHQFSIKLGHIQKALVRHAEDVAPYDMPLGVVNLRYAVILQAVFDLHYGTQEDQDSAVEYFQSDVFKGHLDQTYCPKHIMDLIIYSPEEYNTTEYDEVEEESHDLFI